MRSVKYTPLHAIHRQLGARMIEFGGFEMPLSYSGIIDEHLAVRSAAGLFDLSHMGEFDVRGADKLRLLERAFTNSAERLAENQAQYTLMCSEDGGTIDDLVAYRTGTDSYMLCVNAANIDSDCEWLRHIGSEEWFCDVSDDTALIAIQGPRAEQILKRLSALNLSGIGRFRSIRGEIAGVSSLVSRTGYTGEDGFEIFLDAGRAEVVFEALLEAGKNDGLVPCGLGARDTLRMEAGLPLYGHELDRATSPFEAGLGGFVKLGRGFIGEEALAQQRASGTRKHLIGIRTADAKSIARQGYAISRDGEEVGVITSGTYAPTFKRPLAIGYVAASSGIESEGDEIEIVIRNRRVAAETVALPFYRRRKREGAPS